MLLVTSLERMLCCFKIQYFVSYLCGLVLTVTARSFPHVSSTRDYVRLLIHLTTKRRLLNLKTQLVPRSKHFHGYKNQSVMLCRSESEYLEC
jgi:hypothetical protein